MRTVQLLYSAELVEGRKITIIDSLMAPVLTGFSQEWKHYNKKSLGQSFS